MSDAIVEGEVCIANIGPKERRKRMMSGVVTGVIAVGILGALMATDVQRWWRLLLFLPFYAAAVGYFQARDKT